MNLEEIASRRDFIKLAGAGVLGLLGLIPGCEQKPKKKIKYKVSLQDPGVSKLGYKEIVKEPDFNVSLAPINSYKGRIQRAARWRNITNTVEKVYDIPKDYLTGMICVESMGDPTKPNSSGDGGVGLIHIQPVNARKYGLKMVTDSKKLVDRYQGRKIVEALDLCGKDLKLLIKFDDRFHPIKNIDAAARMLKDGYNLTRSWDRALKRFSGRLPYAGDVKMFAKTFNHPSSMELVEADFEFKNKITFKNYVEIFNQLNRNYGLAEYKKIKGV